MWAHERAAICNRRHRCHELQGGHGNALPDGGGRDIRIAHILGLEEQPLLLTRQIDARDFTEAEEPRIVHEFFRAEREPDLRKARVERVLHNVGEGDGAIALVAPVLDAPTRDHDVAGVEEDLIRRDDALL